MFAKPKRIPRLGWLGLLLVFLALAFQLLPFGLLPRLPSPNCGPEHWRWLGQDFTSEADVLAYFRAHELELISSWSTPRLEAFPPGAQVGRAEGQVDWLALAASIQVEQRLGYRVYSVHYSPLACPGQEYTFKVTSYGFASLYGCCGI